MQYKSPVKIGFVKFIVAIQCIGFIADGHHHRINRLEEKTLRLLRAGLGVVIQWFQQVCSAHTILNFSMIGFV